MAAVVMFSGGMSSYFAAQRAIERWNRKAVTLLFCDTLIEDEDLYRFLNQARAKLRAPFVRLADGRTPWEVFRDERFVGNSRAAPCSKLLKQRLARTWVDQHAPDATIVLGMNWTEGARAAKAQHHWSPHPVWCPLVTEVPRLEQRDMLDLLHEDGIEPPRLYAMGFPHNNCGGFCVKAGQAAFANLLHQFPCRYRDHEQQEESLRAHLRKDAAIMRDRRNGRTRPLTMKALRQRVEAGQPLLDPYDWGGCGCFTDEVIPS